MRDRFRPGRRRGRQDQGLLSSRLLGLLEPAAAQSGAFDDADRVARAADVLRREPSRGADPAQALAWAAGRLRLDRQRRVWRQADRAFGAFVLPVAACIVPAAAIVALGP